MPSIVELVAIVALVTQFIKQTVNNANISFLKNFIIEKAGAVTLGVISSIAVVAFYAAKTGTAFDLNLLMLAGQVAIAATTGYSLLKVARNPS